MWQTCTLCGDEVESRGPSVRSELGADGAWIPSWSPFTSKADSSARSTHATCFARQFGVESFIELVAMRKRQMRPT